MNEEKYLAILCRAWRLRTLGEGGANHRIE